jgi:hypothetical protein
MSNINYANLTALFSGKNLVKAMDAIAKLEECIVEGSWVHSRRSIESGLNKANVAQKVSKKFRRSEARFRHDDPRYNCIYHMNFFMNYGQFMRGLENVDADAVRGEAGYSELVEMFDAYKAAFLPVAQAFALLDVTRPKPVITQMGASPTITRNMQEMKVTNEIQERLYLSEGKEMRKYVMVLLWPAGTRHNVNRWSMCMNGQCEACGHGIRNPQNRVPLLITTDGGETRSLWTGKDCAKTLFGINVEGDVETVEA